MTRRLLENSLPEGWESVTEGAAVVKTATGVSGATLYTGPGEGEITNEMLRDSSVLSVIGRSLDIPGPPGDILATNNDTVLKRYEDGGNDVLGFGKVLAADLDSQAVGVDPVFGADDVTGISLDTVPDFVPTGVWYVHVPALGFLEVFINNDWRVAATGETVTLAISDGTNVRLTHDASDITYYLRQVYP